MMTSLNNITHSLAKSASKAVVALLFAVMAFSFAASGQERVKLGSEEFAYDFRIYFRFDDAKFYDDYLENPQSLAKLDSVISVYGVNVIDSLVVVAKSSPEGPHDYNVRLAQRRAQSMKEYLVSHYPELNGKITLEAGVSPWPKSRNKKDLIRLRYAAFRMVFPFDIEVPIPDAGPLDESLYTLDIPDPVVATDVIAPVVIPDYSSWMTIVALKTNMLYDLVTALNFEVEVPIGKRWSLMWEDVFPWWETGNKFCFQHWEMGGEVRYWFKPWDVYGTEKLLGFFAGVYGMSAKYDFQYDRSLNYQGEYWSAGLSGGWSTALGKKKWANLELSLALGYLRGPYRGYLPDDEYSLLIRNPYKVGTFTYWPLTKAKVSLVIPINIPIHKYGGSK